MSPLDQFIDNLVNFRFAYEGLLSHGLFGERIDVFLADGNEVHPALIIAVFVLGILFLYLTRDYTDEPGVFSRFFVSLMLFIAIIDGVYGVFFLGMLVSIVMIGIVKAAINHFL